MCVRERGGLFLYPSAFPLLDTIIMVIVNVIAMALFESHATRKRERERERGREVKLEGAFSSHLLTLPLSILF